MEVAVTAAWSSCTLESGSNGASAKLGQSLLDVKASAHTYSSLAMPSCLSFSYRYIIIEEEASFKKEAVSTITSRSIITQINEHTQTKKNLSYRDGSEMMKRINGTQLKWLTNFFEREKSLLND